MLLRQAYAAGEEYYEKVKENLELPMICPYCGTQIIFDDMTGDGLPIYTYRRNINIMV